MTQVPAAPEPELSSAQLESNRRPHTPTMSTPPRSKTPPTLIETQPRQNGHVARSASRGGSEPVDPSFLSRRLSEMEGDSRPKEWTPGRSPIRKRPRRDGDRFIPAREGQDLSASYNLLHEDGSPATPSKLKKRAPHGELNHQIAEEANRKYSQVLRNEFFGDSVPQSHSRSPELFSTTVHDPSRSKTPPSHPSAAVLPPASITPSTPHKNLFTYSSRRGSGQPTPQRTPRSRQNPIANFNPNSDLYSTSPIHFDSQQLLQTPRKQPRYISKVPYKVLDAPELADDFYLNLVDWGSSNVLAVGLGSKVYMWNSASGRVTELCSLTDDTVTSVSWIQRGSHVSIGTDKGYVQIWDAERCRRLRTMTGHTARVGALAWNDHILTSGSRDRNIYHRDVRSPVQHMRKLAGHKQEVCGLRWNTEDGQLASGGNDNRLMVWDKLKEEAPLFKFSNHTAAVKAIAWSPHQHHLLASGGGTADRSIKFWNTSTGSIVKEVDTGSQVCNLSWSKNSDEIVSTHGYSQNQIVVWKYPRMEQVVGLTGHTYRVLYLAMSPDGQTVVTGAGDETLRFWKVFNKNGGGQGGEEGSGSGGRGGGRLVEWGTIR